MARETLIQIRRGTEATWGSVNPTLAAGEIAYMTDTNKIMVGDGATAWGNVYPWLRVDGGNLDA